MAESTKISWADATFNPWIGCTKISPGCDHCYAARDNERRKWVKGWGGPGLPLSERKRTKYWPQVQRWNARAVEAGTHPRVFCASLADVFDNDVPRAWRDDLWALIRETTALNWMILTKRIGNVAHMTPKFWPMPHVGIMSTMVNQPEFDRDWKKLAVIDAPWRGVSMEPMLEAINIGAADPDWIITGGESGPGARSINVEWVRSMRDQCEQNGIAFHHKQWGGVRPADNGSVLDGREHKAFPAAMMQ